MDKYDYEILTELQINGKLSIAELGRMIGLSTTATKERVKKLENEGIIKGYTAIIDASKVGMDMTAFITVPVGNLEIKEMADRLAEMNEVVEVHKVTGNTCFLVKVRAQNSSHLEHLIDEINHFAKNTYTYLVLSTAKDSHRIVIDEDLIDEA
ncbi:MAG: Lrp/AsnC family transcriptional regulator [Clostridia bacterium]|nr:Lrp/AsnC family transcriptional regulator [Clostridia bacterium]